MGHLHLIDLLTMAAYAGLMLLVGWWCSRRKQTSDEYFLASRGAGSLLVGISMIATMFSTISYLATPGEMIAYGPGMAWGIVHAPLTFLVVGYFVIPHIMKHRVTSGYELLEGRFGPHIRKAASVLFILTRLIWMGFIIYTCGSAVATLTDLPLPIVLAAVGIVTTLYTIIGGIRAVLITDALQFVILIGGGLLVVAYVAIRCGGFSWWPQWNSPQLADLHWPHTKLFSLSPFDRVTIIGILLSNVLWWTCTASSDQMMIQRYLCTRDLKAARRSFLHCLIGDFAIAVVLWLIGFSLLGYFMRFPEQRADLSRSIVSQADKLFPHFIATVLPSGLRGIVLAALFAAAMSSLSSGISSLGTVMVVDFPRIFARGIPASDNRLTMRAKWIGLFVGLLAIALSYLIGYVPGRNLIDVTYRVSNCFVVPLCVLFLMAFYVSFSTPAGAWTAIAVGVFSGVLFSYWQQIVGRFVPTGDFSIILIMPLSMALSLGCGIAVSAIRARATTSAEQSVLADPPA